MNFRCFEKKKRSFAIHLTAVVGILCVFAFSVDAQRKPFRTSSPIVAISGSADILAASTSQQCQNGKASAPTGCPAAAYAGGALNRNNSHYAEGDAIPYQIQLTAPANSTGNTVTLNWDSTKSGVRALDFLTTYTWTESAGNDICTGTGADCSSPTTFPIPTDPDLSNQAPGQVFTMFGGTITGVSAYSLTGTYAGTSSRSITITFTMGPNAGVAVLAVGGHLSTRKDWGNGFASPNISGSPFHFDTGGNQLQVQVGAVTAVTTINVVKLVHNLNGTQSNPGVSFGFTSVGGPLGNFSLIDADPSANGGGVKSVTTTGSQSFTVQENIPNPPNGYSFTQAACTVDGGGFGVSSTATVDQATRTATITLNTGEGNTITCTYENGGGLTTAATVTIGGRVTDASGRGIAGARISMTDDHGETRTATSNSFGYYTINGVEVGRGYVFGASARGRTFTSKLIGLTSALSNINFVAN